MVYKSGPENSAADALSRQFEGKSREEVMSCMTSISTLCSDFLRELPKENLETAELEIH